MHRHIVIAVALQMGRMMMRRPGVLQRRSQAPVAALEGARYGPAFATGMAAIHTVLSIARKGAHVVSTRDLYGGAWRIFTKLFATFGKVSTVDDAADLQAIG